MFELSHLRTLRAVARSGSFTEAARRLGYTPSAVSQQMAWLERGAGIALFERHGRGMRLTDAGAVLAGHADAILAAVADARTDLELIAAGRAGRLRLGSFPSATAAFVARAISEFRTRYPAVDLTYVSGEPYELLPMLKERELDLAIVFRFERWPAGVDYDGKLLCDDAVAAYSELMRDPYLLLVPAGHPLAARDPVPLADLAGERIMGNPRSGSPWAPDFIAACQAHGFDPQFEHAYHDWDFQSMQAFVATGRGITLLPRLGLDAVRPGIAVRRIEGAPERTILAATPRSGIVPRAAEMMTEVLRAATAELAA